MFSNFLYGKGTLQTEADAGTRSSQTFAEEMNKYYFFLELIKKISAEHATIYSYIYCHSQKMKSTKQIHLKKNNKFNTLDHLHS